MQPFQTMSSIWHANKEAQYGMLTERPERPVYRSDHKVDLNQTTTQTQSMTTVLGVSEMNRVLEIFTQQE